MFHTPLYTYTSSHNHTQSKQITRETSKVQYIAQPRPASRPGWGVSLRRDVSLRRASPSPRREHKNRCVAITGSRLSEIPLAWASCLLAQKVSEPPGRDFEQRPPCFVSPRRDWLGWARLTWLTAVHRCTAMFSGQTSHARYSHTPKQQIPPYNQQITHKQFKKRLKTRTLTSRTWRRANETSTRNLGAQ